MNCRAAQRLLSAERDGALAPSERAGLGAHVERCAVCSQFRVTLGEAGISLRAAADGVSAPDEERAWQDVRRELRAERPVGARSGWAAVRWALPLGVAAALAFIALGPTGDEPAVAQVVARADFVEVPGDAASMVFVDDQSGWLVVWASAEAHAGGG